MKKKIISSLVTSTILSLASVVPVSAANVSFTASNSEVTLGSIFTINVEFTAAAWNIHTSTTGSISDCIINQANASDDAMNAPLKFTQTCTPTSTGTVTVYLTGDITDETGVNTNLSDSVSVVVKAALEPEPEPEPEPDPTPTPTPDPEPTPTPDPTPTPTPDPEPEPDPTPTPTPTPDPEPTPTPDPDPTPSNNQQPNYVPPERKPAPSTNTKNRIGEHTLNLPSDSNGNSDASNQEEQKDKTTDEKNKEKVATQGEKKKNETSYRTYDNQVETEEVEAEGGFDVAPIIATSAIVLTGGGATTAFFLLRRKHI